MATTARAFVNRLLLEIPSRRHQETNRLNNRLWVQLESYSQQRHEMTRISANLRMNVRGISFQTFFLDSDHTCSSFCQGTFTISGSEILSINLFGLIFEYFLRENKWIEKPVFYHNFPLSLSNLFSWAIQFEPPCQMCRALLELIAFN